MSKRLCLFIWKPLFIDLEAFICFFKAFICFFTGLFRSWLLGRNTKGDHKRRTNLIRAFSNAYTSNLCVSVSDGVTFSHTPHRVTQTTVVYFEAVRTYNGEHQRRRHAL